MPDEPRVEQATLVGQRPTDVTPSDDQPSSEPAISDPEAPILQDRRKPR